MPVYRGVIKFALNISLIDTGCKGSVPSWI